MELAHCLEPPSIGYRSLKTICPPRESSISDHEPRNSNSDTSANPDPVAASTTLETETSQYIPNCKKHLSSLRPQQLIRPVHRVGLDHGDPLGLGDVARLVNPVVELPEQVAQADAFLGMRSECLDNLPRLDSIRRRWGAARRGGAGLVGLDS